jgi:phage-related protein
LAEPWTIEFYQDDSGYSPVEQFLWELQTNLKLLSKTNWTIDLLREFGMELQMPYSRPLVGYEFRELRVKLASDNTRIFYVARFGRRMVLLHGFVKKSQKTPRQELEIAQRRYESLRRQEERR